MATNDPYAVVMYTSWGWAPGRDREGSGITLPPSSPDPIPVCVPEDASISGAVAPHPTRRAKREAAVDCINVRCCNVMHRIGFRANGALAFLDHPSLRTERITQGLGGAKTRCQQVLEFWQQGNLHHAGLGDRKTWIVRRLAVKARQDTRQGRAKELAVSQRFDLAARSQQQAKHIAGRVQDLALAWAWPHLPAARPTLPRHEFVVRATLGRQAGAMAFSVKWGTMINQRDISLLLTVRPSWIRLVPHERYLLDGAFVLDDTPDGRVLALDPTPDRWGRFHAKWGTRARTDPTVVHWEG